jgi:soluble lytic murein transglycosylase
MPSTGAQYAAKLGLPWDPDRALHDVAYNRQIGNAALSDLIAQYGTGPGLGMALAAYNAGPGRVSGGWHDQKGVYHAPWIQQFGDPRGGQISLQAWINRIPIKETRDYVSQVLSHAALRLQGEG